jgi:hypothetical protein
VRAGWGECGGFCEEDKETRAGMLLSFWIAA